jgi:hypothetical protein
MRIKLKDIEVVDPIALKNLNHKTTSEHDVG